MSEKARHKVFAHLYEIQKQANINCNFKVHIWVIKLKRKESEYHESQEWLLQGTLAMLYLFSRGPIKQLLAESQLRKLLSLCFMHFLHTVHNFFKV